MIDVDQLERDIAATPGNELLVGKDELGLLLAAIRQGQAAVRSLASVCGAATALAATAKVRVSSGYQAPDGPLAA